MGEKTAGIVAAIARSVGEEKEFERFWAIIEAFQQLFEKDPDAAVVRRRLNAIFSSRTTPEGLLTRRELIALWKVSKQVIQRYEKDGLPCRSR